MPISENKTVSDRTRQVRPHEFIFLALVFATAMAGTTLPTPLYPLYQQQLEFSHLMVAVIFATYAFAVLGALIVTGPWSDEMGRRPLLSGGLVAGMASSLLFLYGGGLWVILCARALSGLCAGLFTATATVAIIELAPAMHKARAAMLAAIANMGGLGMGPLLAGVFSQYFPWPLHLVYGAHLVLLVISAAIVWRCPETVERPAYPRLRRQRMSLPEGVRSTFIPAAIACFAGFALLGLITSLEPAILRNVVGLSNRAAVGGLVFLVFAASLAGQILQRQLAAELRLPLACVALALGAGMLALSMADDLMILLMLGAAVAGLGQGGIFAASIVAITAGSPDAKKAEVTSLLFVVVYLAVSVPVLGLGLAIELTGLQVAGIIFALLVLLLSLAALAALRLYRTHSLTAIS